MSGEKLGQKVKFKKNIVYTLEATFSVRLSSNIVRMFVLMKSLTSLKMGHFGSKSRSQGQILEKHDVCSRGHIFWPIIMKIGQNLCFNKISY